MKEKNKPIKIRFGTLDIKNRLRTIVSIILGRNVTYSGSFLDEFYQIEEIKTK